MGAKAGIGIGVALSVLLLFALAFVLSRRRRKALVIESSAGQEKVVSELNGQDSKIHEAGSKTVYPRNELVGSPREMYELESPLGMVDAGHSR
jgi:hypothetical protein